MNRRYVWKSVDHLSIIWIRVDSWYFRQILFVDPRAFLVFPPNHFLNLVYFQKTTNPFKRLVPTHASSEYNDVLCSCPDILRIFPQGRFHDFLLNPIRKHTRTSGGRRADNNQVQNCKPITQGQERRKRPQTQSNMSWIELMLCCIMHYVMVFSFCLKLIAPTRSVLGGLWLLLERVHPLFEICAEVLLPDAMAMRASLWSSLVGIWPGNQSGTGTKHTFQTDWVIQGTTNRYLEGAIMFLENL